MVSDELNPPPQPTHDSAQGRWVGYRHYEGVETRLTSGGPSSWDEALLVVAGLDGRQVLGDRL